jgi:hypothetical protein
MPFCYYPKTFTSEMVSNLRRKTTREKEAYKTATRGHEEEGDSKGEVYKK